MNYSMARWRKLQPAVPFWLGGEYLNLNGRHWLRDALGSVELIGSLDLPVGSLISVEILEDQGERLKIGSCEVLVNGVGDLRQTRPHADGFTRFVHQVRTYFLNSGLSEIQTPSLVKCPGLEPSLEPFKTEITKGREARAVYLPTSPEVHLKKALAQGWSDIFEVKTCFRRGEFSPHHENEFTMLEWYRGFADLDLVIEDIASLLSSLGVEEKLVITDFSDLFREVLQFDLTPESKVEDLRELCRSLNLYFTQDDTFQDLFHRLMIEHIEPSLISRGPVIVRRFPPSLAALAKLDKNGWADRFELYWRGLEIANAFFEVTDPQMQRERWLGEQKERERLGTSFVPQDKELIQALNRGLPPTAGIAMGLERLYMAIYKVEDIRELRLFSAEDLFR